MNVVTSNPIKLSSPLSSGKSIMTLMVGGSIALITLSGCSQYKAENVATIANPQTAPMIFDKNFDNQASRNQGAWGGVYMAKKELTEPATNIVGVRSIPNMSDDGSMQQWLTKFEGSIQGKTGFFTTHGKKLYDDSCAGCHMQKGEGAQGAGYYPPLANNSKMQSKYYIISVVINGLRGMPSFHRMMSDEQIAAVTQYVHSDLNSFTDIVTPANVAQLRHDFPLGSDPSE
ncbi:c-type cytochrome [uncultured Psychrobacter sp.]|uniref:c-type cytochrome n=1 Tax=uncultured Psychrobacter sp. TaxID=259303 RepID=UPI002639D37B|nr:c-type cytochrome [uncultured Psychrobacter sp.]